MPNVGVEQGRFLMKSRRKQKESYKKRQNQQPQFISPLLKQPGWARPSVLSHGTGQNVCLCARTQCGLFLFYRSGANRIQYGISFFPVSCRSTYGPYG